MFWVVIFNFLMNKKLAIVTTHPIQYNAPWFKLLYSLGIIDIMVFYTWGEAGATKKFDPGFGKSLMWDLPLLEGYPYRYVLNVSPNPGSHSKNGIVNPTLINEIEQLGANAILIFGWNFISHFSAMKYFHGKIPVIFRGDSTLLDENFRLKKFIRRLYLTYVYKNIDFALYTGTNNKQYFLSNQLKEEQLIYAPHAIDNDRFSEPKDDYLLKSTQVRRSLGFDDDDIVLLFAGKFETKKNPFYLVELLKKNLHKKLKLLFVGNGHLEMALKKATSNDKRIVFLDFQNQLQMPVIYRVADMLVLPSIGPGETWGLALNEAMACEKAVAASVYVGGAVDLIQQHYNGIILNPNSTKELDQLIEKVLYNNSVLTQMGINSKNKIQSFCFSQITTSIINLINRLS